jgi:hypothetical protein
MAPSKAIKINVILLIICNHTKVFLAYGPYKNNQRARFDKQA